MLNITNKQQLFSFLRSTAVILSLVTLLYVSIDLSLWLFLPPNAELGAIPIVLYIFALQFGTLFIILFKIGKRMQNKKNMTLSGVSFDIFLGLCLWTFLSTPLIIERINRYFTYDVPKKIEKQSNEDMKQRIEAQLRNIPTNVLSNCFTLPQQNDFIITCTGDFPVDGEYDLLAYPPANIFVNQVEETGTKIRAIEDATKRSDTLSPYVSLDNDEFSYPNRFRKVTKGTHTIRLLLMEGDITNWSSPDGSEPYSPNRITVENWQIAYSYGKWNDKYYTQKTVLKLPQPIEITIGKNATPQVLQPTQKQYAELRQACEGRNLIRCKPGLTCQFAQGSAQDAPGVCVKE